MQQQTNELHRPSQCGRYVSPKTPFRHIIFIKQSTEFK